MGLDLWFREDVARILAATHEAMACPLEQAGAGSIDRERADMLVYRRGYEDALRAVGVAFGVMLPRGARRALPGEVHFVDTGLFGGLR